MQDIKELQFKSELNRASLNFIESLFKIADDYEKDRDEVIKREVEALLVSISNCSFVDYETEGSDK